MSFSAEAMRKIEKVLEAIVHHPFTKELASGLLPLDKFGYYIEQDSLYLQDFARCHALLAARVPAADIGKFLQYAEQSLIAEREAVHVFFKDTFDLKETGRLSPATLSYTSYMMRTCLTEPYEVAFAALVPCFWIYREAGRHIAKTAEPGNPYRQWIDTYTDPEFSASVEDALRLLDRYAAEASAATRERMLDAFYKSSVMEWHFWNDAYEGRAFDDLKTAAPATPILRPPRPLP